MPLRPAPRSTVLAAAPLLAWALALAPGCGSAGDGQEVPLEERADQQRADHVEGPEGMEDWAHLLGHNTPDQDAPDWTGRRTGLTTLWHANGVKQGEGRYDENHVRTGPWTFWYENGVRRWEGSYLDGEVVGVERSWFDDGSPQYEGAYVDGKREGPWRTWHRRGRLMWEGRFSAGKRHGVYRAWRSDGSFDQDESGVYEHGRKVDDVPPQAPPRDEAGPGSE